MTTRNETTVRIGLPGEPLSEPMTMSEFKRRALAVAKGGAGMAQKKKKSEQAPSGAVKVAVSRAAFLRAAKIAQQGTLKNGPLSILGCVRIEGGSRKMTMEGYDLSTFATTTLSGDGIRQKFGPVCVSADRLVAALSQVVDEEVAMEVTDTYVLIRSGKSRWKLRCETEGDWPDTPKPGDDIECTMPLGALLAAMRRVDYAVATEAGRFALHGVLMQTNGNGAELVATDGRRLARASTPEWKAGAVAKSCIVSQAFVRALRRVGDEESTAEVAISRTDRVVWAQTSDWTIGSRLVDGTFPEWGEVIPKSFLVSFGVEAGAFGRAISRGALFTTKDSASVRIEVAPESVTIRSKSPEYGDGISVVDVDADGTGKLAVNHKFFAQPFAVCAEEERVHVRCGKKEAPMLIEGDRWDYTLMPMQMWAEDEDDDAEGEEGEDTEPGEPAAE